MTETNLIIIGCFIIIEIRSCTSGYYVPTTGNCGKVRQNVAQISSVEVEFREGNDISNLWVHMAEKTPQKS